MPIDYFNPTPIYYDDVLDLEFKSINEEIKQNLTNNMYSEDTWQNLVQTTGKTASNIFSVLDLPYLEAMVNIRIRAFLKELKQEKNFIIFESWFNKLPKYGYQDRHTHHPYDANIFSGVFFYEKTISEMEPLIFFIKNSIDEQVIRFDYKPGRIIIFSGLIPHKVTYNKNEENRTSFSFNFRIM